MILSRMQNAAFPGQLHRNLPEHPYITGSFNRCIKVKDLGGVLSEPVHRQGSILTVGPIAGRLGAAPGPPLFSLWDQDHHLCQDQTSDLFLSIPGFNRSVFLKAQKTDLLTCYFSNRTLQFQRNEFRRS